MVQVSQDPATSSAVAARLFREPAVTCDDLADTPSDYSANSDPSIRTRPSYVDARVALRHVEKDRATGNHWALWIRAKAHHYLGMLGDLLHRSPGKVIFVGILILAALSVGLKSAHMVTGLEQLWVQEGGRLQRELTFMRDVMGDGWGTVSQSVIQTSRKYGSGDRSRSTPSSSPNGGESSLLHPRAMLDHLNALLDATSVSVRMFDVTWRLKDLCYAPAAPPFGDEYYIEQIMDNLFPCAIITPLDCFWEGSKLLGPNSPVALGNQVSLDWISLNPQRKLRMLKNTSPAFPFDALESFMKRAGITNGYQEKPCLDPHDPECPETAPNKKSKLPPNVAAELTGGCYGFATKYMHWPEQFVVGGTVKNRTGYIVRGEAVQSTVQLMGEIELYQHWVNHYKVHNIDWSMEKAKQIIIAWQNKFATAIEEHVKRLEAAVDESGEPVENVPRLLVFSLSTLDSLLAHMSELSLMRVAIGIGLITAYAVFKASRCGSCFWFSSKPIAGGKQWCRHGFLAAVGVLLIVFTVTAGLGLSALVGISFNAISTQVVPFLAVGLGVGDVFCLFGAFLEVLETSLPEEQKLGAALRRGGFTIIVEEIQMVCCFLAAAIIPLPALRTFSFQMALLSAMMTVTTLILFPAAASVVLFRKKKRDAETVDPEGAIGTKRTPSGRGHDARHTPACCHLLLSCCFPSGTVRGNGRHRVYQASAVHDEDEDLADDSDRQLRYGGHGADKYCAPPSYRETVAKTVDSAPNRLSTVTVLAGESQDIRGQSGRAPSPGTKMFDEGCESLCHTRRGPHGVDFDSLMRAWSISHLIKRYYAPFVLKGPVMGLTLLLALSLGSAGVWSTLRMREGLDLTDIVPRNTPEHAFLDAQSKYFGFYHIYAVTGGDFEYPGASQQQLLHEFHDSFVRVSAIIKNDDGGLPPFWLSMFRDWLKSLQSAFDADWVGGAINQEGWNANASAEGILAYKLLVQTGHVDDPVDKSQVSNVRLVDDRGVIRPTGFYNYLSAWVSNDALAYSYSEGALSPLPRVWYHDPLDTELRIPKSAPLQMAFIPFQLVALDSLTEALTDTVGLIRSICDSFRNRGLPTFPAGVPFTFWEQYTGLKSQLLGAAGAAGGSLFLTIAICLGSPWAALISLLSIATLLLCLSGAMTMLLSLQLSAVPAVLLVCAIGLAGKPTIHILLAYSSALGSKARRTAMMFDAIASTVFHSHLAIIIPCLLLAVAPFDFIVRYFFCVIVLWVMLSMVHCFLLLPVFLALVGPPAEVCPTDGTAVLPLPSPELRRPEERTHHRPQHSSSRSVRVSAPRGGMRRAPNIYPPPPSLHRGGVCGPSCDASSKIAHSSQSGSSSRSSSRSRGGGGGATGAMRGSQISLSTITEEPNSLHSSHEIVVQPELVLETSLGGPALSAAIPTSGLSSSTSTSASTSSSSSDDCCANKRSIGVTEDVSPAASVSSGVHFTQHHRLTTRVTATAKFKLEVVHPGYALPERESSSRSSSKRRRSGNGGTCSSAASATGASLDATRPAATQPNSTSSSVSSTRSECDIESSYDLCLSSSSSPSPPPYRRPNPGHDGT